MYKNFSGMHKIASLLTLAFIFFAKLTFASTYIGEPNTYLQFLPQLQPGDTLLLTAGEYYDRLNLDDIAGEAGNPIVITGPEGTETAIFYGNACCNTISIERCAYLVIQNLTLDGQNIPYIDAVKAEGTSGNWAHHITVQNLLVINHGGAALTVGISTKCTAWDWIIRKNTFLSPGLGMYLGNSDGTAPFINGLIEYNLVINPLRYGIQIKHQNEGLRTIPGMTTEGKTTIRYNVISRAEGFDPAAPRPNLLVGNFPASGPGSNDYYEIYGNFLWQNPIEGLFQGTGNYAFYNNVLVNTNPGGWALFSFPHNGFAPRNVLIFNNTIISASEGIEIQNPDPAFTQLVSGNAVFAPTPLDIGTVTETDNVTAPFPEAGNYLVNPAPTLPGMDLTPLPGALQGDAIDFSEFVNLQDFDKDFDGNAKGWNLRGAYAKSGTPAWNLLLEMRPEVNGMTTDVSTLKNPNNEVLIYPNPASNYVVIKSSDLQSVTLIGMDGMYRLEKKGFDPEVIIDTSRLPPGLYQLILSGNDLHVVKKLVIYRVGSRE